MALKVFIDKGHGADDPGACGNGMREADIVDVIGNYVALLLADYENVEVKIGPRPAGPEKTKRLNPRPEAANAWKADIFVSLHINAGGGTGVETLVSLNASAESKRVANIVNTELVALFTSKGMPNRGVKSQDVLVLRKSNMPAILAEYGFIDREKDASLLKTDSFRKECAQATVNGLVKAYNLKKKSGSINAPTATAPTSTDTPVSIVWDGKLLEGVSGINRNGETFLPARFLGESAGHKIGYVDGKVTVNGVAIEKSINVGGHGYVRSTELGKAIGYSVVWGSKEKTVYMAKL